MMDELQRLLKHQKELDNKIKEMKRKQEQQQHKTKEIVRYLNETYLLPVHELMEGVIEISFKGATTYLTVKDSDTVESVLADIHHFIWTENVKEVLENCVRSFTDVNEEDSLVVYNDSDNNYIFNIKGRNFIVYYNRGIYTLYMEYDVEEDSNGFIEYMGYGDDFMSYVVVTTSEDIKDITSVLHKIHKVGHVTLTIDL